MTYLYLTSSESVDAPFLQGYSTTSKVSKARKVTPIRGRVIISTRSDNTLTVDRRVKEVLIERGILA